MIKKKTCSICKKILPATTNYFNKHPNCKYGLNSKCRECTKKIAKEYYYKNRKKIIEKEKQRRKKNILIHKKRMKKYKLKQNYNLTIERYNSMLIYQKNVCLICGKKETKRNGYGIQPLSVDHNHRTGEVRGLLCNKCNSMIGFCDENPFILIKMIKYLRGELYK